MIQHIIMKSGLCNRNQKSSITMIGEIFLDILFSKLTMQNEELSN